MKNRDIVKLADCIHKMNKSLRFAGAVMKTVKIITALLLVFNVLGIAAALKKSG